MAGLRAYDLRVDYRTRPLDASLTRPRFSWRLRSELHGDAPSAYRVVVRAAREEAPSWDSGWVDSGPSNTMDYAGAALRPWTAYHWTLRLRDGSGTEVQPSESSFETELGREQIAGEWISRDPNAAREFEKPFHRKLSPSVRLLEPVALFRKQFDATREVRRARLHVSARGVYRPYLNGIRVGDHELAPGWTDYRDRILYQTHDVTELLQAGSNVLGIALADGWWSGYVGFDARRHGTHYGDFPEAWAQLILEFSDGTREQLVTDGTWLESSGAIRYSDMLMGELVDSRHERSDWSSPGADMTGWAPVLHHSDGLEVLEPAPDEPIRACEELPARSVTRTDSGWVVDFGQNLVGRVRLTVRDQENGARIQLRHGEEVENGELYTANLRSVEATDVFIADGSAVQLFEPWFTIHGFRYAEVTGLAGELTDDDIVAVVLRNDLPWTGELTTSSADLNQLVQNIRWSQRGNFVAVPTDCPQRDERMGWTADAQVFLPTAALNADVAAFFTRWMRDVRYNQTPDGSFPLIAPTIAFHKRKDSAPGWGDAGVLIPWQLYRSYGDERILRESLDSMIRWVEFIERNNPELIWRRRVGPNYGDWLEVGAETSRAVLATAYFARSTELLARSAEVLGEHDIGQRFSELAARIRAAFVAEFVADDGTIESDTQTVYALALEFELLPPERQRELAAHMMRAIERTDGLLTTGFLGAPLLCAALTRIGRSDLAYRMVETDRYPSWLHSVRLGATTIWERWDSKTAQGLQDAEMNSFNHYSFGSVGSWLYNSVVGIDQTESSVGYKELLIAPRIDGSLTHASGSFESPVGRIECAWRRHDGNFELMLTVPPGTTARVVVPGSAAVGSAQESDAPCSGADGVFVVGSGRFRFHSRV